MTATVVGEPDMDVKSSMDRDNSVADHSGDHSILLWGEGSKRNRSEDVKQWSCEEVGDWLEEKGLGQYVERFKANHVTGVVLMKLSRESLLELIPSLGHRVALFDDLERLRGPRAPRHVGEGVVGGISGLASKLVHGLDHLLNDPIEGVSREGMSGLMKGLSTGIVGAIQSPVEGVALLSWQLGEGLRHTPDAIFGRSNSSIPHSPSDDPSRTSLSSAGARASPSSSSFSPSFSTPLSSASSTVQRIEAAKPDFLREEAEGGEARPSHIGEGILMGMRSFGSELYDGVTGILTEPMKAAIPLEGKNAPSHAAIARGFAKGLTGAICKPVAGGFELAHATVEGLMATPNALASAARDGPSIRDTPTFQRLANLRLPSADSLRGLSSLASPPLSPDPSVQLHELGRGTPRSRSNVD